MRTARSHVSGRWIRAVALAAAVVWLAPLSAGSIDVATYHNHQALSAALKAIAAAHPDLARLSSIGKTLEGRDIWAIELANTAGTPVDERPGLLVAANFEGDHLVGSEIALFLADYLAGSYPSDATVKDRLDRFVVYIIPRVNADGAEQMFASVKSTRRTNLTAFDADNDGRADEDGPQDLNKDGLITQMRVKDPKGPYMIDPADPRMMKRADPAKGETGGYAIYWEGIDKDNDGFIAEDGPGGADINRNFMHQYPYFQADAGRHMVSESETRAMLDFVLKHANIAATLSFGESDNLIVAPSRRGDLGPATPVALVEFADRSFADARRTGLFQDAGGFGGRGGRGGGGEFEVTGGGRGAAQQPAGGRGGPGRAAATTINPADIEYFLTVSEQYRQLTGVRAAPPVRTPAGAFFEYGYFQFGVPSFSTPGWGLQPRAASPQAPGTLADEEMTPGRGPYVPQGGAGQRGQAGGGRAGAGQAPGGRGGAAQPGGAEAGGPAYADQRLLRWMDAEKIDGFVKWTPFKHPALGEVEIGGFKPYAASNPPSDRIPDLAAGHARFALYLTSLFPRVKIASTEVTSHGAGIFRIKAQVTNTGYLPTSLAHGVVSGSVKPTMVQIGVDAKDIIAGNEKTNFITALAGSGGVQSYEWIVKSKPGSTVTLTVVSQKSGKDSATLTLK